MVYNQSEAPIWDVEVPIAGREDRPLRIGHVPPRGSAGNGWLEAPEDWHLMNVGPGCPGAAAVELMNVVFIDNLGRRWKRVGREEPIRLLDP
ncbi:hypothetical protein [Pseudosporangium ferrugineum]|uniref:Uncharacterized protein n=1 Tax=Pseudosporangium ferrugineum TaxID=439699 RepID=A0A2T0R755_9ACTN|nr:hypothetical protein [Pseudosporangium ferrugineum]PRY17006.1 hypothetical protein CLV70_1572 [Pseudosporangium ferrugineum]